MTSTDREDEKPWAAYTAAAFLAKGRPKSWWRRNLWGLVAVLPLLAFAVVLRWDDIYWRYWRSQAHVPLVAAQQQWVGFSGAEMRLVEFGPATGLVASGGKPFEPPAGVKAWRAVIEFKVPDQERLAGCSISLEDTRARTYSMAPNELSRARGLGFETCTASGDADSTNYRSTVYFVMPSDAEPAAVRIIRATEFPNFARLSIGS